MNLMFTGVSTHLCCEERVMREDEERLSIGATEDEL